MSEMVESCFLYKPTNIHFHNFQLKCFLSIIFLVLGGCASVGTKRVDLDQSQVGRLRILTLHQKDPNTAGGRLKQLLSSGNLGYQADQQLGLFMRDDSSKWKPFKDTLLPAGKHTIGFEWNRGIARAFGGPPNIQENSVREINVFPGKVSIIQYEVEMKKVKADVLGIVGGGKFNVEYSEAATQIPIGIDGESSNNILPFLFDPDPILRLGACLEVISSQDANALVEVNRAAEMEKGEFSPIGQCFARAQAILSKAKKKTNN